MTWTDEQQAIALERAALSTLVDSAVDTMLREIEADKKQARSRVNRLVEQIAQKGFLPARKLLQNLKSDLAVESTCPVTRLHRQVD